MAFGQPTFSNIFLIISDEMYVSAFQRTGCPNPSPWLDYWKKTRDSIVFQDMMTYCNLVKDGNATSDQITHCCGTVPCTPKYCNKVMNWKQGNFIL